MKKIAFVHCRTFPWWALNVFVDLIKEEFSGNHDIEGKVFTLIGEEKYLEIGDKKLEVIQSLPNRISKIFIYCKNHRLPILSSIFDYRNLIFFYPVLMKLLSNKIRKFWPEKVVISSFAVAKNISVGSVYKKLYLHSPIQYVRSHYDEYIQKIRWWKWIIFKMIVPILRKWDKKFTKFDECVANSRYTAGLAKEIYWMECKIKYPKVSKEYLNQWVSENVMPYFVYVWRLVSFVKECDVIIELFNKLWTPLIMIGSGPDELYLKSLAKDNIKFLWWNPSGMVDIIRNAKWFINLTKESFWLWTIESLLLWVPALWYNQWWTVELVDKESGILVDKKDIETLINAMKEFDLNNRNREIISENIKNKLDLYK